MRSAFSFTSRQEARAARLTQPGRSSTPALRMTAHVKPLDNCDGRVVARALSGREFDDGDVYRACTAAAKSVMWDVAREVG